MTVMTGITPKNEFMFHNENDSLVQFSIFT